MSFERLLSGPFFNWLRDRLSRISFKQLLRKIHPHVTGIRPNLVLRRKWNTFENKEVSLKDHMRAGASDAEIAQVIWLCVDLFIDVFVCVFFVLSLRPMQAGLPRFWRAPSCVRCWTGGSWTLLYIILLTCLCIVSRAVEASSLTSWVCEMCGSESWRTSASRCRGYWIKYQ